MLKALIIASTLTLAGCVTTPPPEDVVKDDVIVEKKADEEKGGFPAAWSEYTVITNFERTEKPREGFASAIPFSICVAVEPTKHLALLGLKEDPLFKETFAYFANSNICTVNGGLMIIDVVEYLGIFPLGAETIKVYIVKGLDIEGGEWYATFYQAHNAV